MSEEIETKALEKIQELAYRKELNVFKVLKNADHEIRHSSFLAWLFDPEENHGFGSEFAVEFFYNAFKVKGYTRADWAKRFGHENFNSLHYKNGEPDTYIATEVPVRIYDKDGKIKKGRIDIFVKGTNFTCTIENKTYSDEHDDQLNTYKSFINNKYEDKDYENFFIYLGIKKPDDFYEDDNDKYAKNPYKDYTFISYKMVINILEDLMAKHDTNLEVKKFIEQYLYGVKEFYGVFDPNTYNLCKEIMKDPELAREILDYDYKKLTQKLIEGKKVFRRYVSNLQNQNNEYIRKILDDILNDKYNKSYKDGGIIKDDYGSGADRKDGTIKYGYALTVLEDVFHSKKQRTLNTVDFDTTVGLRIRILAGMLVGYYRNLIPYIKSYDSFYEELDKLRADGWKLRIAFYITEARGNARKEWDCNLDDIASVFRFFLAEYIKGVKNPDKEYIDEMVKRVKEMRKENLFDEAQTNEIIDKLQKQVTFSVGWQLDLSYPVPVNSITANNEAENQKIYREKTIEGLNLFGIGDKFAKKYFKE